MKGPIETTRLYLVPTSEDDTNFIYESLNSPKWLQYIGDRNIKSEADAKDYIRKKIVLQYEKSGFGTYTVIKKRQ